MSTAYISFGSNIGDRAANMREAIERLRLLGEVTTISPVYETEPVEFTEQPWFLNCVVELKTELKPTELLEGILDIEKGMGRGREVKKGPRNIDLDILLYDDQVIDEPQLTIPHPAMHERRFVLEPLAEIAPEAWHPVDKRTVGELRDALPAGPVVKKVKAQ